MVVRRAGSHVRGSLHHQHYGVHALYGGGAVEASGNALLRHCDAVVWVGRRDHQPYRGDTAARALVARMAYHAARAVCPLLRPRRVPGAALRIEHRTRRTPEYSGGASRTADAGNVMFAIAHKTKVKS